MTIAISFKAILIVFTIFFIVAMYGALVLIRKIEQKIEKMLGIAIVLLFIFIIFLH